RLATVKTPPAGLEKLWQRLGDADPAAARLAMADLLRDPGAVSFLDSQLRAVPRGDAETIAALIADLDHPKYPQREKARAGLEKLAGIARPALEQRLKDNPSIEMKQRIVALLERLNGPTTDAGQLRVIRAIEVLEWLGTPEARRVLERLRAAAPGPD